jgi:hypothetical protein
MPDVRIDFTSPSLRHPDIVGPVFEKMRRVAGAPFPLASTTTGSVASAIGPDAAGSH